MFHPQLCAFGGLWLALTTSLMAAGHPNLLLDSANVALLKQRIESTPWAKAEWTNLKNSADKALDRPLELPPRGGNWSHNYVCPTHGSRLKQGKKIGPWQWEHICPVGRHVLKGGPSKATLDFDGNAISGVHFDLAREVIDHGLIFQVTGDARHAARAREILLAYAGRYRTYPLHDNQGRTGKGARIASQSLTEGSWIIDIAQGADLVWSTFSEPERQKIADQLLRAALEDVILKSRLGIHNIQCRLNSAIGLVGFLLNDKTLIERAIDDPQTGYRQQMEKGVLADGMWTEGSSGYHFFTITGLLPLTEAARHNGIDLYGPKLKSMFDAPLILTMPNFVLPDFNDSGPVTVQNEDDLYEVAYARYRDPAYVPLLAQSSRKSLRALLYGVPELPPGSVSALASRNSIASGYAILQQGPGRDATWLCLKYGPHGGGHGHPDKNHFVLYARGQVVAPDGGTHAYGSELHKTWDKTTFAHNTLVVDEHTQQPTTGKSLAFGSEQGVDFSMTAAGPIYAGVSHVRTVVLVNTQLVVFVDQVRAEAAHTIDIVYHQFGAWEGLAAGKVWTPPSAQGYKHIKEPRLFAPGPEGLLFKTRINPDWTTAVCVAGRQGLEILTGYCLLKTTEDNVPLLIQRQHGAQAVFAWAVSLDGAPVNLRVQPVTDAAGKNIPECDAVMVRVDAGRSSRRFLINPTKASISAWRTDALFAVKAE